MLDLSLPPALFDLEEQPRATTIRRRPGHQLTIQPPFITCECDARTMNGDPHQLVKWCYAHLGIAYDTDIEQAINA